MATIESQRENIDSLRTALLQRLDGMSYCLDWKSGDSDWSAREIVYHLLDTPPGGNASLVKSILSGEVREYEIWSDRSNLTDSRAALELSEVESDIGAFFGDFMQALANAADGDLQERRVVMHQRTRGVDEERTLEAVLTGFDRHWREHLVQLEELRATLGL